MLRSKFAAASADSHAPSPQVTDTLTHSSGTTSYTAQLPAIFRSSPSSRISGSYSAIDCMTAFFNSISAATPGSSATMGKQRCPPALPSTFFHPNYPTHQKSRSERTITDAMSLLGC